MRRKIVRTQNFVEDAAAFILQKARAALTKRNAFSLSLSGGNTPRPVYARLAESDLPWERILFTFGDERCVPPENERSNYRMARESLFLPAEVPEQSILRMRGESEPHAAASDYEQQLQQLAQRKGEMIFQHDLILLGMGDDGHTASLFPGTPALAEKSREVVANFAAQFNEWRLTFTFPFIARARAVLFLIDGDKQPDLLEKVLAGDTQFPAARVVADEVTWMIGEKL